MQSHFHPFSASLMETSKERETPVLRTQRIVRMGSLFQSGKKWNIPWILLMSRTPRPSRRGKTGKTGLEMSSSTPLSF